MQGARNAETGMYTRVHEDFEYRATPQTPSAAIFTSFRSHIDVAPTVKSSSIWSSSAVLLAFPPPRSASIMSR